MKKTTKKLSLNRDTLRRLDGSSLQEAKGAEFTSASYCASCDSISCASQCIPCLAD
jgi:hypothetical protein